MQRTLRARSLAFAAALAALASCDSPEPLGSGDGRSLPPDELRYAAAPFPAPANLTAVGPGLNPADSTVTLTWEDVAGDEMYVVQWRRGDGPDVWKSLVTTGVNRTSYTTRQITFTGNNDYRVAVITSDFRTGAFATVRLKPGAFTQPAIVYDDSSAILRGFARPNGASASYWFQWGTDPSLAGASTTAAQQVSYIGNPVPLVERNVRVVPGATYYYRIVGSGAGGTTYGEILSFIASPSMPTGPTGVTAVFSTAPVPLSSGGLSAPYSVSVRWTHDGAAVGSFRVQRRPVGTPSWTQATTLQGGDRGFLDRAYVDERLPVTEDTTYEYRVLACALGSQCASSSTVVVPVKGLPAPGGLGAAQAPDGRVVLTWRDLAGEESYPIQWRAGETGSWQLLVTAGKNVTSYTTDRVVAGVNNYYRVAGEVPQFRAGAYAQTVLAAGAGMTMTVETGAATFPSSTSARVNGTVTPNGIPATAWIEWGTDPALATWTATAGQAVGSGFSPVSFAATFTVPAAGKYYYRAAASNAAGTVRGAIGSFDTSPPPAPVLAAAFDAALFQVPLSWTYSGVTPSQFRVWRRIAGETAWKDVGGVTGTARSFVDATVPVDSARDYEYRVRACTPTCTESNTAAVQAQALAAPGGFTAVREANGQVTLSWGDVAGEVAYLVQWRASPTGAWQHVVSAAADRTSFTTPSVTPGTTNYYRVAGEASNFRRGAFSETSIAVP